MTKSELVSKIAEEAELTKAQAEKFLSVFITETITALKAGDKVTIVGFGVFSATERAARIGRNPQTGAPLKIAAKTNGKFTPGKDLKDLHPAPIEEVKPAANPAKEEKKKKKK